jgi:hypothetical protein
LEALGSGATANPGLGDTEAPHFPISHRVFWPDAAKPHGVGADPVFAYPFATWRVYLDPTQHGAPRVLSPDDEKGLWLGIIGKLGLSFTDVFLAEEWRHVVLARRIGSAAEYLAAKRPRLHRRLQIVRPRHPGSKIEDALNAESIHTADLANASTNDAVVQLGTMHRMKGLEFRCVTVAGVSAKLVSVANAVTPINEDKQAHP